MKKTFLNLLLFMFVSMAFIKPSENVFICVSKTAVAYHSHKMCRGLQKCTHEIKEVKPETAFKRGLRACKLCY